MNYFTGNKVEEYGVYKDGRLIQSFATEVTARAWAEQENVEGAVVLLIHSWAELGNGTWVVMGVTGKEWTDERSIDARVRPWRRFEKSVPIASDGTVGTLEEGEEFWSNSHYLVFKRPMKSTVPDGPDACHLSMRTVENDARHDWREMQRVKNELLGEDWEGVELYPAETRVVDTANQFHLFCFPFELPFGFTKGLRMSADEAARVGAVQRERA